MKDVGWKKGRKDRRILFKDDRRERMMERRKAGLKDERKVREKRMIKRKEGRKE